MKTKISRFSKSVLSVILAMTLIMSTMLIGTITVNAEITGLSALYFTPDSSKWADASATFKLEYTTSGGTNTRVPFELIDSENSVYKATLDSSTTYTKFKFWRYSSDGKYEWNSSNEFYTIPTGMNYFTKTSNWWNTWDPVNGNDGTYHGTWSTYSGGSTTTQISSWSFTGYQKTTRDKWTFDSANPDITGETGFYEFDTQNSQGNLDKSPIYFRMVGHKSDSTNYVMSNSQYSDGVVLSEETKLSGNSARDIGTEMNFTPSMRYVKFTIGKNSSNQYTLTITQSNTSSVTSTYTVTAGDCTGGSVTVGGSTSSVQVESGTQIPVIAEAAENYEFVSWNTVEGVSFDDANSATTNATITGDATITATFRSTATPTKEWRSVALIGGILNGKSIGNWTSDSSYSFTYNEEDDTWYSDPIEFTNANNEFKARVNGTWDVSFGNGVVGDNGEGNFTESLNGTYIFYVKDGSDIGTSALKYKDASTPTPKLSLSPTSANLAVGGTLTLKVTHTECKGTVSFASDKEAVATVNESGVVTAVAKGTATITAKCANGETATCKITVSTIPYAQANRLYAYAKTLGADETPALNAWVASETNASKINTHNDNNGNVKPTLGRTSDTNIRIFLPTTASSDKVVLYNSFSSAITVNGKEIPSGEYKEVSYTPNTSMSVSNGKTLTIYKSTADGALYVNNTGEFASIDDNGALSMINKLYSDKETGEIAAGNAGALADANGVKDVAVKKIKGRGNSTWVSANKKSFNVTFDANINAFGFEKGKKFSLLANFKDPSLSRNKILYELADLMGVKYSPDAATVDLYMNGLYMGSYLMCQKVDVGSKELVNDLGKTLLEDLYTDKEAGKVLDTSAPTIQKKGFSFLMELDSNAGTGDFYTTVDTQKITIKEPEYLNDDGSIPRDAVTQAAIKFVQDKYKDLNTAMSNTSITLENLNKIIDVESLAKYYLINEIAKNYDIGVSSTYLVYNYTKGKFYISPLWDMDVTTGNCKYTESDYQRYEGNWTDNNSSSNYFMKKVMANPQVQSAARKLWTGSYYTTLTNYIDTLTTKATSVEGSLNCNYTKWNYPYGFQGKYKDNVQALKSLNVAAYNPSDNTYTVASSSTSYATTAVDQTKYVSDWLKSRVAWMSKKYNTYYLTGDFASSWNSAYTMANNSGVNTYAVENISSGNHTFKICTDGGLSSNKENSTAYRDWSATSISYNADLNLVSDSSKITNLAVETEYNNITFTTSETMTVYFTFNQKTNTLTLSDKETTSSKPTVTLSGSDVDNADIKDGTAVTLTATITPATSNNVVVTGDYTATLYIGDKVVTTKTVTFADDATEETTMNAVFSTYLEGTNQTYKVVVTCNDGEQDLTGTSNTFTYKQTGIKDQKIYFDPSTHTDSNSNYDWLDATTKDSTVTVTIKNSSSALLDTFKMYIDSDDIHGLDKGVFRGDISEDTLAYFKDSSNTITFSMDNTSLTCSVAGQSDITSGWIYNYSSQVDTDSDNSKHSQALWEQYNVEYEESYPGGCTTYAEFKAYLAAQVDNNTDNIVYFDNSASKWYNVYIYGWGSSGPTKDAVLMKKLPYADIWYYDFESDNVTASFLFKDRSNRGYGNNYQQTVDLVDGYVLNGDNEEVTVNFESTINTANPIFITQNFYKITQQNGDGVHKFRAFNTQWDEFAEVVASDVQTKAVDVYFDLHDDSATDIQLYHSSTNAKYTFASEFTRLTQMPGSTIYHSTIMLPYTDNGIAFKFDKFVVNYSGGKKTCAMSANVQPTFTCINTGEVWYEINSDFDYLGYDTAVSSASLLKANSPLLNATTYTDIYLIGGMNNWTESDVNWQLSSTDGNKYTGTFTISGGSSDIAFKVFDSSNSGNKYFANGNYQFNSYNTIALGLNNNQDTANMSIMPIATSGDITLNVTYYREYTGQTQLEITQTVATADATYYVAGDSSIINSPFTGSEAKMSKNDSGVYYYHFTDIAARDYNFKITNGSTNWDVANMINYSSDKSSLTNITVSDPNSFNKIKVSLSSATSFTVYYDETNVYIIEDSSTPTPPISLSAASTSLTLVGGVATTTLTTTKTNAGDAIVTYTVDPSTGASVSADGNTFTATAAGTYTVTASITVNGTTYSDSVTIIVADEVTEDYCGVLAYNHSTATFDVTGGGTIDSTDVVLTNGYYFSTGDVTTGYTSYDGTTYTVIYALPSTGKTDASTSYSSNTRHSDSTYTFDGWTKDGVVKTDNTTLTDSIIGTATVAYVANWSKEVMVTYTFTYKYDMYDTSSGREYDSTRAKIENSYVVQISLSAAAGNDEIEAAYFANAPKISSDYFTHIFDGEHVTIVNTEETHTAEAKARIASVKKYKVTFESESGIIAPKEYFYQNIAELTSKADAGYVTVWKDENNNILYVGNTYKFRVTRNIVLTAESVASSSINPATYINEPTYEFYTKSDTEYVRFNFRVDNVLSGVTPYEYGTLYFFTDENGVPVDSSISVDDNIDASKLAAAAMGSASTGIKKYNATGVVNKDHKFIYAPSLKNTVANRDRYLRVYSYFIYKDEEDKDVVVISADSVIASIRNALNQS